MCDHSIICHFFDNFKFLVCHMDSSEFLWPYNDLELNCMVYVGITNFRTHPSLCSTWNGSSHQAMLQVVWCGLMVWRWRCICSPSQQGYFVYVVYLLTSIFRNILSNFFSDLSLIFCGKIISLLCTNSSYSTTKLLMSST